MNQFLETLSKELLQKHKKRPWLSLQTKISLATINGWYKSNRTPKLHDAYKVAQCFNVSLEYLIIGENHNHEPHFDDPILNEICDYFCGLTHDNRQAAWGALKMWHYISLKPETEKRETG